MFADRVKALLRRHVVERCIYGVDINPLAVELARVSLWVETLDPELPFSFLDHKIKVGNSLVGCWLDRVEDYPLKAWEREGGDGKDGPRSQRIEEFLKGERIGKRRTGDGRIKREMREVIESRFSKQIELFPEQHTTADQVVAEARSEYEGLHNLPIADPDERERFYREHVQASPALRRLKQAMDEWCAVWFWPVEEDVLRHVPTPLTFHQPSEEAIRLTERLADDLKFFHWELEFPDVFTPQRNGYDAVLGNPPWETIQQESLEFFSEHDPLYRTYGKQTALGRQKELFALDGHIKDGWERYCGGFSALANWIRNVGMPSDLQLARGDIGNRLSADWANKRSKRIGYADSCHPFVFQGSGKVYSYKSFLEVFHHLLANDGRLGIVVPTSVYSDFGSRELRELLLFRGRLEFLYAFQNEKRVFAAAHHAYKQVVVVASKGGVTEAFACWFRMGVGNSPEPQEIPNDMLLNRSLGMTFTPTDVRANSPKSLSFVEFQSKRDLEVFRTVYAHSFRVGDSVVGWELTYAQEVNLTSDSRCFPPRQQWESRGYAPDVYGRWIGPDDDVALPLYQGAMIYHFTPSFQQFESGSGRVNNWTLTPNDRLSFTPKFLISEKDVNAIAPNAQRPRFAFRDITSNTNERTLVGVVVPGFPCGNTLPVLSLPTEDTTKLLFVSAAMSSLVCDYVARMRMIGSHMNSFILQDIPVPLVGSNEERYPEVVLRSARLTFIHRRFAPEWTKLRGFCPKLTQHEWKHWWAVTEADRLRLRVEIDALCADLYGLEPDDFDWIVRDDRTDSKGFYRVDKELPFRERLTGLAAAAFRALKDGKWSTESAANLPNDEFFDIFGIPELTSADAAKAKGLPGPLILRRDGCHVWQPENFPPDDPRHGWTWDDCWNDAIALLGSREAVEKYIAEKPETEPDVGGDAKDDEPFQLKADRPKAKQKKMF